MPTLDYLDGEALGSTGGRPRHQVEVETGYYNNGLGARLSTDWRSATRVDSGGGSGDLRFSSYADVDLRAVRQPRRALRPGLKHPWLRGTSVRFEVDNIFNARPKVRDANGDTPFSYQPDLLEPTGRTVGISFRKLFVPIRFFQRGGGGRRPDAKRAGIAPRPNLTSRLRPSRSNSITTLRAASASPHLPTRTHFSGSRSL